MCRKIFKEKCEKMKFEIHACYKMKKFNNKL